MAVAVKNSTESPARSGPANLVTSSLLGAVLVLGAIGVVTQGVPYLWNTSIGAWLGQKLAFVSAAGLLVVVLFAIGALAVLGTTLIGPNPPKGLRAGIFTVLATVVLGLLLASPLVAAFEALAAKFTFAGLIATLFVAALFGAVLYGGVWLFQDTRRLEEFEGQGWFSTERYKPAQGLRVRRATMLGLLVLLAAGVYSLATSTMLTTATGHWMVKVPFTDWRVPLLPDVALTAPLILGALALWLSYRAVNFPVFADFLIATEAEVNKISWPTKRSVIQDTIVVLATVVLMTLFLLVVDLAWGLVLSLEPVGVLKKPPETTITNPAAAPDQSY